jgi:hypothetical protein
MYDTNGSLPLLRLLIRLENLDLAAVPLYHGNLEGVNTPGFYRIVERIARRNANQRRLRSMRKRKRELWHAAVCVCGRTGVCICGREGGRAGA